ncbi:cyclic peptide export ABC transporter [Massilia forsythiae]|uniref:Cyclic peptide export ABC transporter n=1 Tax=Massilia forsythiae TaxID=2728020 RepID=A0A7Z2VZ22_9BURK|nr:cyclic peptide export ABC transporter [Massilia forsythiae]QJE01522.1 cyclic peptide export ABC transporter [Massilia forsythiae]
MKLFDAFSQKAPNKVFFSIVLGALAGVCYAFLIPTVLDSLAPDPGRYATAGSSVETIAGVEVAHYRLAAVFLLTCAFILFARSFSQIMLLRVSMDVATSLRIRIYHRIASAPIVQLERMGSPKLIAALTTDVARIVMGARMLPDLLISIVTLVGMLGFLLYMNAAVFWFVMGAIVFGVVSYQIPMYFGNRYFVRSRHVADDLQESIRALIYGAKELKLNQNKRASFFDELLIEHERKILQYDKRGFTIVRAAMNYGDLISFFVIGAVTFVFVNYHSVSSTELLGVIMALLYVTGPVTSILNFIPQVIVARVSLNKVTQILDELPEEEAEQHPVLDFDWQSIVFKDVCYQHPHAGEGSGFQVGPVSLELERGQVTFIVGGNGSGKSTLSKLMTLHYLPQSGSIRFGDVEVDPRTLVSCRQQIGAIFTDYYLFDRLLGLGGAQVQERVMGYLSALQLDHKVTIKDGRFSTLALSDGQKKRLALLVSLLEDKSLYLFDEWAADQDPVFKQVFYQTLLPELRARNKAVVVISHDDRYFDVADKVLVMEDGRLARVELVSGATRTKAALAGSVSAAA